MKAIVSGDSEYVARSFDDLPPGAHAAVRASPSQLPDSGLALRLAGFEIRDTIAHIVGDRIVWWILARKPLDGTVAANVLAHGVGGLNIDASRVGAPDAQEGRKRHGGGNAVSPSMMGPLNPDVRPASPAGRFPANVLLDEHAAKEMDQQSGVLKSGARSKTIRADSGNRSTYGTYNGGESSRAYDADSGGASRFFPRLDEDGAENWIRRLIDPDQSE